MAENSVDSHVQKLNRIFSHESLMGTHSTPPIHYDVWFIILKYLNQYFSIQIIRGGYWTPACSK
jgi:hypothetical protein